MAQKHTVKSFDDDLRQLRTLIAQLGGMAETQIVGAMDAMQRRDSDMAIRIITADKALDQLETETEQRAIQIIALRAPMADDLREIVSALKISGLLERIGDYAKNIAKRTTVLARSPSVEPQAIVPEMGRLVAIMVKRVLDAYVARDAKMAKSVWESDKTVDDLYNSLFRSLLTCMMEHPANITPSTHLLFIAKNLERIGDHATNIAEIVHYNVTGVMLGDDRPKSDMTSTATMAADSED
jgi:phosphate transport system protein